MKFITLQNNLMKEIIDFLKGFDKHTIILMVIACWWFNSKINDKFDKVEYRLSILERDVATIKTVLITKGIMPERFASKDTENETKP